MNWAWKFSILCSLSAALFSLPTSPDIISGEVSCGQSDPNKMVIEASHRAILEYDQFHIGEGESVQFIQPNAKATVLNRVIGKDASSILGNLQANGRVFLVNPNGIYFGPTAQVNIGSLVASTLDISNQDFLNDRFSFSLREGSEQSEIVNRGLIHASTEGAIAFLAPIIRNEGVLCVRAGRVLLAGAEKVTLDFTGDGLIRFSVDGELEEAVVEHLGSIQADEGDVFLRVKAAGHAIREVVNADGLVEATRIVKQNGVIRILGEGSITSETLSVESEDIHFAGSATPTGDLHMQARETLTVRDSPETPCILTPGGALTLEGSTIDILAFDPATRIMSGSDMLLISPHPISADAHFYSGGEFALLKPNGMEADFRSLYDPIISATSSVRFAAYTGVSLKVESLNRIRVNGAIDITGPDVGAPGGDSDSAILQNSAALILRSGLASLEGFGAPVPPNQNVGGTTFQQQGGSQNLIELNGGTITTAGGPVILADGQNDTRLISDLTINTSGGDVTFTGRVNSGGGGGGGANRNFTINAGAGDVTFQQVIGDANDLGTVSISGANITLNDIGDASQGAVGITSLTATNAITFTGTNYRANTQIYTATTYNVNAGALTSFFSSADPLTFSGGTIQLANGSDLSISSANGAITLSDLRGNSLENVTIDAGTGDLVMNSVGIALGEVDALSLTGDNLTLQAAIFTESISLAPGVTGTIFLSGGINTNNTTISFPRPVSLQGTASLSTNTGIGNITFSDTVNGGQDLTLSSGTGNITFSGAVGDTTRIGALQITSVADLNAVDLTVASLNQSAGTGTSTYSGAINTNAAGGITWVGTNFVRSGTINTTNSGPFTVTNSGALTVISGSITTLDGPYLQNGTGAVSFSGNFTTTNDDITFTSPVTLTGNVVFNTGAGAGDVVFLDTVNGTTAGVEDMTLTLGTGSLTFTDNVGLATRVGAILINGATNVSSQAVTAASFVQNVGTGTTTFDGALNTNGATGVALTGTVFAINNTITTSNSGPVTLTNSGTATFAAEADFNLDGGFTQNGTGLVSTAGDITTNNQTIDFLRAITLTGNVSFDTGAGAGDILLQDTVDGGSNLVLASGTGDITLSGALGGGTRLGVLQIDSVQNFSALALTVDSILQNAGTGTSSYNGPIDTNGAGGISWTGNNFNRTDTIVTTNNGPFIVDNSGTLNVVSGLSTNLDGFYNQTGSGPVLFSGNMTTTNDDITFAGPVTLTAPLTLNSGAGGGNITFNNTVDATTAGVENLTLIAGTGDVTFASALGSTTRLGVVQISSATNVTAAAITAGNLLQVAGTGTTSFNGTLNTNTVSGIDLTGSIFNLNGDITTTLTGPLLVNNSALLTIDPTTSISLDGVFTQSGAGAVSIADSIVSTNDTVSFAGPVTLIGPVSIDSGAGVGDILFTNTVDGGQDLTLDAGTGNITFSSAVGGITRIGALQIDGATNLTANGITAASIAHTSVLGTTTLNGSLNTNALAGISLDGNIINLNSSVTTTNGGTVTLTNLGQLTIAAAGDMNLDGSFTQNGAGIISTAGDITTNNQSINFLMEVTLTGNVSFDTGAGAGNILFSGEVEGPGDLTLAAGTGNITLSSATGSGTRLGVLQIDSVQDFSAQALTVDSILQNGGTGTSSYSGAINTDGVGGISWTGNNFNRSDSIVTTNSGPFVVNNSGALTVVSGLSTMLDGFYNQSGSGAVFFSGSMTTTNDSISFSGPVTLTAPLTLDSGALAGNITFNNTINGTTAGVENLTLIAGTGDITLASTVGAVTRLGTVEVQSANNVTFNALSAGSLIQVAGSGTTTFNGAVDTNTASGMDFTGAIFALNSSLTTTNSGTITFNHSGAMTLAAAGDVSADGAFLESGGGAVSTAGDITTTNDNITFQGAITLTGDVNMSTGAGVGDITYNNTIDGAFCLTTNAGTGTVFFNGAVGSVTPLGCLDATAALIDQNQAIETTGTIDITGTLNAGANMTTANNDITITGSVLRDTNNAVEITTGAGAGDLLITGTINADGGGRDLTLTGGTGSVTVTGAIGAGVALDDLSITGNIINIGDIGGAGVGVSNTTTLNATDTIEYNGTTYNANSQSHTAGNFFDMNATSPVTFTSTNTPITFSTGVIRLFNGNTDLNMLSNGAGNITIGDLLASLQQDVTINADTGDVTVAQMGTNPGDLDVVTLTGNAVNNPDPIFANSLIINAATTTTLNADFTSASPIVFNNPVLIAATPLTISTCPGGADITFNDRLDADSSLNTRDLIIDPCGGNVTFNGPVGSVDRLTSVTIQNFNNLDAGDTISVGSLVQTGGTGTSTYNGAIDTNAAGGINWSGNIINRIGAITTTNGGIFTVNNSGLLTISSGAATSLDGAYSQTGTGPVQFGGNMTTTGDSISFNSAVTMTNSVSLNTGAGAGDIIFSNTVDGGQDLNLTAGTGAITFSGAVGAIARIGTLTINSVGTLTAAGITAGSILQSAGSATSTFNGALNTDGINGISLTGTNFSLNDAITTTSTGNFSVTHTGTLTIGASADMNLGGSFLQAGGGSVSTSGDIITSSQNIDFTDPVVLSGNAFFDTGNAGVGDIAFASTIDGPGDLTLRSGTGNITISGAIGGIARLGALQITSVQNFTAEAITADSIVQLAGSGTTTFNGAIDTDGASGLNWTGTNFNRLSTIVTTNGGPFTVNNTGVLNVVSGGGTTLDGPYSQTGTGPSFFAGTMTTSNDSISFAGPLNLSGALSLSTGAGIGDITFSDTINGAQDLTLTAGTGDVTFSGEVGGIARIGVLQIVSATNVNAADLTVESLNQVAGSGTSTYSGVINTNAVAGINWTGTNFVRSGTINTTNGGTFTVTNSGTLTVLSGSITTLDGAYLQNGAGDVFFSGNFTTSNDDITFTSPVTLTGDVVFNTGTGVGDVVFLDTVDGTTAGVENLTLTAGTGNVSFSNNVGSTIRLGAIVLNSATNFTTQAVTAASIVQSAGSAVTTFNGALNTNGASGISLTGNVFAVNSPITTTNSGPLTFTNSGTVTQAAAADFTLGGAFTQNGLGSYSTAGDISTSNQGITFLTPITLTGNVSLNTGSGAGDIALQNTVDGGSNLVLASGTGNITLSSAIGGGTRLGTLQIDSVGDFSAQALTVDSILQNAGTGTSSYNGPIDTNGIGGISWTGSNFNRTDTIVTTNSGPFIVNNSGTLNVVSGLTTNLDGFYNQTGAGPVLFSGNMTTTNDSITFAGPVTLTAPLTLNSGVGAGDITFNNTVDGTTNGVENLTLIAGTGSVTLASAIGSTTRLGTVQISSATNFTAAAITAGNIVQVAGAGTTSLNGQVNTNGILGIDITSGAVNLNNDITTTATGPLLINNAGLLTINPALSLNLDGIFTQSGAGAVSITDSIVTTNDTITFTGPITLLGTVNLSTGSGAGGIVLNNTIDGGQDLTLSAGVGDITFTSAVGGVTRLGDLQINGATNITANAITAASFAHSSVLGTATFNGAIDTNGAAGISLDGNIITINDSLTTTNTGPVTITNLGQLTIAAAGDMNLDGSFIQNGVGIVSTAGDITTNNQNISFSAETTLTANVSLDTGVGAGNILFSDEIEGPGNLTLASGVGNITLSSSVGQDTRLGVFQIDSVQNFFAQALTVDSILQNAGAGTSSYNGAIDTNGVGGITWTGNNFNRTSSIVTTNGGPFIINNTGTLTVVSGLSTSLDGLYNQTGAGPVFFSGTMTTTNDSITFAGPVTLTAPLTLNSGSGVGDITFNNTIDGTTAGIENLTLIAGTGDVTFSSSIGGTTRIGILDIQSATNISAGALTSSVINAVATNQITLNGAVNTSGAGGMNLTADTFQILDSVTSTNSGSLSLNSMTLVSIPSSASINLDGGFTQSGSGTFTLGTGISANNDVITITSPPTLDESVALSSAGGDITIFSTVNPALAQTQSLTLTAGTGDIVVNDSIGNSARLGGLQVTSANDAFFMDITTTTLSQLAGVGTTTFDGVVDTNAAGGVQLSGSGFTMNADFNVAGSGPVQITNSGLLTIVPGVNLNLTGLFDQNGTGGVLIGMNLTTTDDPISFAGPITLTGPLNLDTGAGAGNITLTNTVDGAQDLTFSAGGGNIVSTGNIGSSTRIGSFVINSAADVTLGGVQSTLITQSPVTGTSTYNGTLNTNTVAGISLTGGTMNLAGDVVTTNGGPLSLTNSGLLTLTSSSMNLSGPFTQNGAGNVTLGASITTANQNIDFLQPVTFQGIFALDTGTGVGDILFQSTIEGNGQATLSAGMGNIPFTSPIGSVSPIGSLTVTSASQVTLLDVGNGGVGVTGALSLAGDQVLLQGTTYRAGSMAFTGPDVQLTAGADVFMETTGSFTLEQASLTAGANLQIVTNGGPATLSGLFGAANESLTLQTTGGAVSIGNIGAGGNIGVIDVVGGPLSFTGDIQGTSIDMSSTGNILDQGSSSALISASDITLNAVGDIGTFATPIVANATNQIFGGASFLANFSGSSADNTVHVLPFNAPCVLIFNGATLADCRASPPNPGSGINLVIIPGNVFYVVGIYAEKNNLGSKWYFEEEPASERTIETFPAPLFYELTTTFK